MRALVKFSISIAALISGYATSSSASSYAENGCEFYSSKIDSPSHPGLQALLQTLPESSSVIFCNGERNVGFSILDPIDNRDGVSFYRRNYYEMPAHHFSKATSAKDLLSARRNFHRIMMALDPNLELTHQSEDIVRTSSTSPGTFKILYNLWMEIIEDSQKLKSKFDVSDLDGESKARYEKLLQSLNNSTDATIEYLEFKELRLADGEGIDLEFFPRLTVNISTKTHWWEIDYDMLGSERYTLLNVELWPEATETK
ncbi:MAG: hypothetical protein AAF936_17015 [Pseudomonadota bacterium]